jgi:hypothetical protein
MHASGEFGAKRGRTLHPVQGLPPDVHAVHESEGVRASRRRTLQQMQTRLFDVHEMPVARGRAR